MIYVQTFLLTYYYLLFIYVIMSFWPNSKNNVIGRFIADLVEPYLNLFKRPIFRIRAGGGYMDLSFLVAMLSLMVLLRIFQ